MLQGDRSLRWFGPALASIAVAAFVIRVAFIVVVDPSVPPLGDATAYHLLADLLARGHGYIRPFDYTRFHLVHPTAEYPPLFPAVLSVAARVGVHGVRGQRIFAAMIGAGTVALVGLLGRRVATPAVGVVAALLAAVYPMLFLGESVLMAEALYAPLVVVVLLLAYRAHDDPAVWRFSALGAAIGFATLTRAEGALLGLIVLIPMLLRSRRALIAFGAAIVVVAPWTIRNAVTFHAFVPVSNNVASLIDGANCDATYHGTQLGEWVGNFSPEARTLPQAKACFEGFDISRRHFDEATVASTHERAGISYARDHIGEWPKVAAVRVLRTWGLYAPRQQVNFETLEGRPHEWQMRGTIMFWMMLPLAIAGAFVLRRRRVLLWPLLAPAVTVCIVAALTYGQQRFRIAAEPSIIVLTAVTLVALGHHVAR